MSGAELEPAGKVDHVGTVERDARQLAQSLRGAIDAGVGPAQLLPRLVLVFKEAGLFSGNLSDLPIPGGFRP